MHHRKVWHTTKNFIKILYVNNRGNYKSKRRRPKINKNKFLHFNAKIGHRIQGNMSTVTKRGQQLTKMVDRMTCKGL